MMHETNRKVVPVVAVLAALVGCAGSADQKPETGQVSVAMTSTATDGTMYRLSSAYVGFISGPTYVAQYLDTSADHILVNLPVATYNAYLYSYAAGGGWALERLNPDGTVAGTVDGVSLLTVLPVSLTVAANQTVPLIFTFRVPTGGTVTFAYGTVDISVAVQKGVADWYSFTADSISTVAYSGTGGPSASTLSTALPGVGAGLEPVVAGSLVGDWVFTGGYVFDGTTYMQVCTGIGFTLEALNAGAALQDWAAEISSVRVRASAFQPFCIGDNGTTNVLLLSLFRNGVPNTPTYTDLTGDSLYFYYSLYAELPQRVFDYSTGVLDLEALMGTWPITGYVYTFVYDLTTNTSWYYANAPGETTFRFVAH